MAKAPCDRLRRWLGSSTDHILVQKVLSETGKGCAKRKLCLARRLSIDQCDMMDKRVLMRLDFDVPMKDGYISNTERIEAAIPNIQLALLSGAKSVVLVSHLGEPGGRAEKSLSLRPVADVLEKRLGIPVTFLEDCVGAHVEAVCADPPHGSLILLENLRFHKEEEGQGFDHRGRQVLATDAEMEQFRASLSTLGDIYVNDALSVAHLSHSSVVGCAMTQRASGLLMKKELDCFFKLLRKPQTPFLAIVGGAKVSHKVAFMEHLLDHVTDMIVVGGIAFTFLQVLRTMEIGDSQIDNNGLQLVSQVMEQAASNGVSIHLPLDFLVADRCADNATIMNRSITEGVPTGTVGVDIGVETRRLFGQIIGQANTIVWNGPPGLFEWEDFSHGSKAMMDAVVQATGRGAVTVLLGGDTITCAYKLQAVDKVTHFIGGRTTLEMLEGKIPPGLLTLSTSPQNKRVVIRADFDVPMHNGRIVSNQKIRDALPTILHVIEYGAKSVVLVSHLECPNGQPATLSSLQPVARELERLLCRRVVFINECVGRDVENKCADPWPGSVFLLENLRFHPEEEGSHIDALGKRTMASLEAVRVFRESLSKLGDIFINDAFETCHTTHSSVVGIDLPVRAAGFQLMNELDFFNKFLYQPRRPFLAILGGLLMTGKIVLIDHLLDLADNIIIAGGLAFTFLKVLHGTSIGGSMYDQHSAALVPVIVDRARTKHVSIHLPVDMVVANRCDPAADTRAVNMAAGIDDGWMGLDIGAKTQAMFADVIGRSRTILWHGPPGVFEMGIFSKGTELIVNAVVEARQLGAVTMIQGTDTVACCKMFNPHSQFSRVCPENGVSVEHFLENELPGVEFLDRRCEISENVQQHLQTRWTNKKVEFTQPPIDNEIQAFKKWTPPYTKKLPPLPAYQAAKPRIKYSGAPLPGMSIPSPHTRSRKKNWTQHSTSQAQGKLGIPDFPDHMMPGRCVLPPLPPKPRVPIQMETLATLDTFHNLTVHINGASKNIPQEADVQVTLVEGYVPLEKLGKKGNSSIVLYVKKDQWEHGQQRSATRTQQSRLSKFKHRISLTSLNEESRRLTSGTLATRQPRAMEYQCSRKTNIFPM